VRLPETVQTLYAELLDQLRAAEADRVTGGSFVAKEIRGRRYWYLQRSEGGNKRQIYLGAESPALLQQIGKATEQRKSIAEDEAARRDLVAMLAAGGMHRESAAVGTVLRVLAEAGVFRSGGVLVGTQAFSCIANSLGVVFEKESLRTADIDIAHDATLPIGIEARREDADLLQRLRIAESKFFAVPQLDPREPSTSFKVRGRDLRVDFLTPARSRKSKQKPVVLAHLGVAAQPLEGLDYLIADPIDAAVIAGGGVHVNVPDPARFAFHKLWVATQRSVAESAKSRKDVRQATQLLTVLRADHRDAVDRARRALMKRASMFRAVKAKLRDLDLHDLA